MINSWPHVGQALRAAALFFAWGPGMAKSIALAADASRLRQAGSTLALEVAPKSGLGVPIRFKNKVRLRTSPCSLLGTLCAKCPTKSQ